ncbi:MAG: hypothetical protein L7S64_01950 [Longimicrobiales bacterium]|nr:hypothetical protein [Longimicrobiales bacterium]
MNSAKIALLASSVLNLVTVGFLANSRFDQDATDKVLRAEKLEIVNSKGEVCAILAGYDGLGGSLSLLRPDMKVEKGQPPVFAYLGSPFPSVSSFYLTDGINGECSASIAIEGKEINTGQRSTLTFQGVSEHGSFEMHAGRATAGEPSIKIKNGGMGVVLEK